MAQFVIEYTTNLEDRHTITMKGKSLTDAYLQFVYAHPSHYIITEIKELSKEKRI